MASHSATASDLHAPTSFSPTSANLSFALRSHISHCRCHVAGIGHQAKWGRGDCLWVDPAGTFCICLLPSPFLTEMTRPFARLMSVNRDGWQAQSGNLLTLPHFRGAGEKDANRIQQQPLQIQQILRPLSCSPVLPS